MERNRESGNVMKVGNKWKENKPSGFIPLKGHERCFCVPFFSNHLCRFVSSPLLFLICKQKETVRCGAGSEHGCSIACSLIRLAGEK